MEQNFQTSFIPKKPMLEQAVAVKRPTSLFWIIAIFIFLVMVLGSAGAYFYKGILTGNIAKLQNNLNLAESSFEPAEITKLEVLDKRLNASSEVLANHLAVSPIFEALQGLTLGTIRYTKFSYDFADDGSITVKMSGQAVGYRSIALQADMFTQNKNIIDPSFSNLTLDDKGNVLFDLEFSVNKSFVNYEQMLKTESNNSSGVGTTTGTGTVN